jgi:hypothetical protein
VHPTTGATKVPGKTRASASAYRLTPPTLRKRVPVPRDISWIFRKRRAPDAGAQLIAVSGDKAVIALMRVRNQGGGVLALVGRDLLMRTMKDPVQGIRIESDVVVPTLVDA